MGKPKIRFQGYTEDWEQRKTLIWSHMQLRMIEDL